MRLIFWPHPESNHIRENTKMSRHVGILFTYIGTVPIELRAKTTFSIPTTFLEPVARLGYSPDSQA
jgi:hypothetical protein